MKISIVAPMYNEAKNIHDTFGQICNELDGKGFNNYEIIFVNDGSEDDSWSIAKELAKNDDRLKVFGYEKNQGRGKALRTGFEKAQGETIVSIDFDLSYDVTHITRMINTLISDSSIDTVLTSCYMPGGKIIGIPAFRLFISKMANLLYRYAFTPKIYTSTCVVRAYKKDAIKSIDLDSNDKEIHLEILSKLIANKYRIIEIPGTLTRRKKGKSKFKFTAHSISHILFFIQERPFVLFGLFGLFVLFLGFISVIILLITRFGNMPDFNATFISQIVSPSFVIILFLAAFQILGIGFIGTQINFLKREMFKMQSQIIRTKNNEA